jgi:hypothetical protein
MALNVHEVANSDNDLLNLLSKFASGGEDQSLASLERGVDLLKAGDGESGSLARARLSLRNDIRAWRLLEQVISWKDEPEFTFDDRHDRTLLNGRRAFETVSIYA